MGRTLGMEKANVLHQCRDKSPEELRTSAKKYAARVMHDVNPGAAFNEEYVALLQFLYLKELKQETDELLSHQEDEIPSLVFTRSASSSMSSLMPNVSAPLPTIYEDPRDSSESVHYEANDL